MESKDENRLFVGKIPGSVSYDELLNYFSQFGTIKEALYPPSTKASRIGFITYSSKEELDGALAYPHELHGSKLNATVAQPRGARGPPPSVDLKKETRIFVGGVPTGTSSEELEAYFGKFGKITKVVIPPGSNPMSPLRGYAFITYGSTQGKENALAVPTHTLKGAELRVFAARPKTAEARPSRSVSGPSLASITNPNYAPLLPSYMEPSTPIVEVEMDENPTRLFVGRLPNDVTKEDLKEYFSAYGNVTSVVVPRAVGGPTSEVNKSYAFVTFSDTKEFWKALAAHPHTYKDSKIEVIEARPKTPRGVQVSTAAVTEHRIFVGRIPETVSEGEVRQYFNNFGNVTDIFRPKSTNKEHYFTFIIYESPFDVAKVLAEENHVINGNQLNVTRARPRKEREGTSGSSSSGSHAPPILSSSSSLSRPSHPSSSIPPSAYRSYSEQVYPKGVPRGEESSGMYGARQPSSSYASSSYHPLASNNPYLVEPYAHSFQSPVTQTRGYEMGLDPYASSYPSSPPHASPIPSHFSARGMKPEVNNGRGRSRISGSAGISGSSAGLPQYGIAPIGKPLHRLGYTPY